MSLYWDDGTPVPADPRLTATGPRLSGTCNRCFGELEMAVTGVYWHASGESCHVHVSGSGCCRFLYYRA